MENVVQFKWHKKTFSIGKQTYLTPQSFLSKTLNKNQMQKKNTTN